MADPAAVVRREIAAAALLAEEERQQRPPEPEPEGFVLAAVNVESVETEAMDVNDGSTLAEPEREPAKEKVTTPAVLQPGTETKAGCSKDLNWEDNLQPLTHLPGCPFNEDQFQSQMKDVLLTPQRFEALLINENRKHIEDGKRHGRKLKNIHKRPTKDIANDPFVVAYLKEQRELVTKHRQERYNLCDCKLKGQSKVRTIATLFPSDLERQQASAISGVETLPDLFLEKRTELEVEVGGRGEGRVAQSRRPCPPGEEDVAAVTGIDTRVVAEGSKIPAVAVLDEKHLLVKTNAEITELDVCMAMAPYNQMDVFPIMIPGHGPMPGVASEPLPSTSAEAAAGIVDNEAKTLGVVEVEMENKGVEGEGIGCNIPIIPIQKSREELKQQRDLYKGLNLNLSEDDTTTSDSSNDDEEQGILT